MISTTRRPAAQYYSVSSWRLWARSIKCSGQSGVVWLQFVRSFIRVRPVSEVWPAFVYSLRTVQRRVRTVCVGTPTILTHKNKRPAWRIALAKFILAANLPLKRFYNTFTCPNVTLTLHFATCISIKWLRARSIKVLDQSDWNQEGPTDACSTNRWSVQTGVARPCLGLNNSLRLTN